MPITIHKGTIIACDDGDHVHRYLVEKEGRILFVGNDLPELFQGFACRDHGQRALLPAFIDTHLHFSSFAFFAATLDVRSAKTLDDLKRMLRSHAESAGAGTLLAFGFSPNRSEGQFPLARETLDEAVPHQPVMIMKYDGHAGYMNTAMLKSLPRKIHTFRGFSEKSGHLYQEAFFAAVDHVTRSISPLTLLKYMIAGADQLAQKGIGMIHTAEGVGFPRDMDVDLVRWFARGLKNPMQIRVFFQTMDTAKVVKRHLPRVGGCFATALDGCFGSQDAALTAPYAAYPTSRGILYYGDRQLTDFVTNANRLGLQVQLHAIGDAAFDQAVRAFESALSDTPRNEHRHTIIHACLPTRLGLERCACLGIGIATQPIFLNWPEEPLAYLERLLGNRAYKLSPYRDMLRMGIRMTGGSDAPCTPPDPIAGIHAACNHYVPEQSTTISEALKMFTSTAAWMSFDDKDRGTLSEGKIADIAILSENPLSMSPKDLNRLRVEGLILSGKAYRPGQSVSSLLFNMIGGRHRPV
jgi:predicted amidohydrolase YtcJ